MYKQWNSLIVKRWFLEIGIKLTVPNKINSRLYLYTIKCIILLGYVI